MASDPPSSDAGTPDGGRATEHLSTIRALAVLAAFVVATVVLVAVGSRPSVNPQAFAAATTTTTTAPSHNATTSTTTTTVPRGSVTVVVANATGQTGLAAHYTALLAAQGWSMKTATDGSTHESASRVYYAAGQQQAAASIATTLGLQPGAVLPLTTSVPVSGTSGIDVVVVVGADLVTQS